MNRLKVALSDSIASGHGLNDDSTSDRPSGCRRSQGAYPHKVVDRLRARGLTVNFPLAHFLACSGASVQPADPLLHPYRWLRNQVEAARAQIATLPADRPVLISISIGANDYLWAPAFLQFFQSDDAGFRRSMTIRGAEVRQAVAAEIEPLRTLPNVAVVFTEYADPFNPESIFFPRSDQLCPQPRPCHARTVLAVDLLNQALANAVEDIDAPERIVITDGLPSAFRGHEAPRPGCGGEAPDVAETWIQYPADPASISYPFADLDTWQRTALLDLVGSESPDDWRGDCLHPNEQGADAYAAAVVDAALPIMASCLTPSGTYATVPPGIPGSMSPNRAATASANQETAP
ncbi:MAG: SGNH/GDSL hydrolase family protein [Thermomicrobiales bacterium]